MSLSELEELRLKIEMLKTKMEQLCEERSLSDSELVETGQQLEQALNQYSNLKQKLKT